MTSEINDQNIIQYQDLISPEDLQKEYPLTPQIKDFILESRQTIQNIISKKDDRFLCIIGPCSIHNIDEAKSYGKLLKNIINIQIRHLSRGKWYRYTSFLGMFIFKSYTNMFT